MNDRILVLIVLGGGNDGLNTLIPLDTANNNAYYAARPTIAISNPIELDAGNPGVQLGIHPAATGLKNLYDAGKAAIIQGVHYPNANKSHFIGTDIKISAKDGNTQAQTGASYIGQWLDRHYPNYPEAFPNPTMPDVLGLGLGFALPGIIFNRAAGPGTGIILKGSPTTFRTLVNSVNQPSTNPLGVTASKQKIAHWYGVDSGSDVYSDALANAYQAQNNIATYQSGKLADQLKDIARLIGSGSKTRIYVASIGGFDTHSGQVVGGNTATGAHANLLTDLFGSVDTFLSDLNSMGSAIADRVQVQTFTEFGRQVGENGSLGTDHGTSSPVFIFGNKVNPGVIGANPDIVNLSGNDIANFEFDYRRILNTTMGEWLGAGPNQLLASGLNNHNILNFIAEPFVGTRDLAYNE